MKSRYIFLLVFIFFGNLQFAISFQENVLDSQIKASLVRVSSIGVFAYSYSDSSGIKVERSYFLGNIGSGVLIDSRGYILAGKNNILENVRYNSDSGSYLEDVREQIINQLIQQESLQFTGNVDRWQAERGFVINSSRFTNVVVLANKVYYPFTILDTDQVSVDRDLIVLKIDCKDLPVSYVAKKPGSFLHDRLYWISGNPGIGELQKYYTNLGYNFSLDMNLISGLFGFRSDDLVNWQLITEKIVDLKIGHSGIWFNAEGEVKAFLISTRNELRVINQADINSELDKYRIRFTKNGSFNLELDKLNLALQNKDNDSIQRILLRLESSFYGFAEISRLKTSILDQMGEDVRKDSFFSSDNLSRIIKEYKLYVIVLSTLLVLIILSLLISRIKKNKEVTPDLPEESYDDDRTELSRIVQQKLKDYIDVYIKSEFHNSYSIDKDVTHIGRDPSVADVIISDLIVSKLHCTIRAREGVYFIVDENSTNGIYDKNSRKIDEKELSDEEEINLGRKGKVRIVFHKQKSISAE
jgi:hypothetical protein